MMVTENQYIEFKSGFNDELIETVITSYSIHYTKLYDSATAFGNHSKTNLVSGKLQPTTKAW